MNEKNLIAIVTEMADKLDICPKKFGIVEECQRDWGCEKCITMCLTKEEETETEEMEIGETEVESIAARNEFMKKFHNFFTEWEHNSLVVFHDGTEDFLPLENSTDIEDTIAFLCELCEDFSEEAIIAVNEEFDGTEKTFYDCFGDICDIYAR